MNRALLNEKEAARQRGSHKPQATSSLVPRNGKIASQKNRDFGVSDRSELWDNPSGHAGERNAQLT